MPELPHLAPDSPDLVWFRGKDAVRFLNDLVSQEIAKMAEGEVRRSLLLGPQGKLDHVLWVLRGSDEVGLVTGQGRGDELAATLGRYRIRVEVEITPETEPTWIVIGDSAPVSGSWSRTESGLVADVSWRTRRRSLVVGPQPDLYSASPDVYEEERIRAGEARWGIDIDEKTIPQESGLVDLTVDFTKGCFLGQELVARIDSRGHVNRHLRILDLDGAVETPAEITHDDKSVGTLTSAVGVVGMGMIRREIEPGDSVLVGSVTARVMAVPQNSQT